MPKTQGFAAVNGALLWQQAPSLLGRSVARGIGGFTSDAPPASKPPPEHYEAFVSIESDGSAIKGNGRLLDGFCNNSTRCLRKDRQRGWKREMAARRPHATPHDHPRGAS